MAEWLAADCEKAWLPIQKKTKPCKNGKHAEKRSLSKEDRVERDDKKRRKLKAEFASPESMSDIDL